MTLSEAVKGFQNASALQTSLAQADEFEAGWILYWLRSGVTKRRIKPELLQRWVVDASGLPAWLLEESLKLATDRAEALALFTPPGPGIELHAAATSGPEIDLWIAANEAERTLLYRWWTGTWKPPRWDIARAVAEWAKIPYSEASARWQSGVGLPPEVLLERLRQPASGELTPLPFSRFLEGKVPEGEPVWFESHGNEVRLQWVRGSGVESVWDADHRPVEAAVLGLPPNSVVEGVWNGFRALVRDVLVWEGTDLRTKPFALRRQLLVQHFESIVGIADEPASGGGRAVRKEGKYGLRAGWVVRPPVQTVHARLLYVERSASGRGFVRLTFGLPHADSWMPLGKIEMDSVDGKTQFQIENFVKGNLIERRGPILTVDPVWTFELVFHSAIAAPKLKCGFKLEGLALVAAQEQHAEVLPFSEFFAGLGEVTEFQL